MNHNVAYLCGNRDAIRVVLSIDVPIGKNILNQFQHCKNILISNNISKVYVERVGNVIAQKSLEHLKIKTIEIISSDGRTRQQCHDICMPTVGIDHCFLRANRHCFGSLIHTLSSYPTTLRGHIHLLEKNLIPSFQGNQRRFYPIFCCLLVFLRLLFLNLWLLLTEKQRET